jgi:poly(A)-specific ribonuclease
VKSPEGAIPKYLSNMQKRIVHRIICKDYPNLKSRGERTFVQISFRNLEMEKQALAGRLEQARANLVKDIGFRWIIEALVGGDLSSLTAQALAPLMPTELPPGFTPEKLADRLQKRLKENRPVLVGHNCLTDLIYIYRCFIGPLPDTVEGFQIAINELFPMIVDTKYVATHGFSSMNPASSLEEENRKVAKLSTPGISMSKTQTPSTNEPY